MEHVDELENGDKWCHLFYECIPIYEGMPAWLMQSSFSKIIVFLTRFESLKMTEL